MLYLKRAKIKHTLYWERIVKVNYGRMRVSIISSKRIFWCGVRIAL